MSDGSASERPTSFEPQPPARVHDVAFAPRTRGAAVLVLGLLLGLSCAFTAGAGLLVWSLDWTPWFLLGPVLAGVVILALRAMWLADWRENFARMHTEHGTLGEDLSEALRAAPAGRPFFSDALLACIRKMDARRFRPGDVVRVGADLTPIRVFDVPFEPTPLEASDPQFRGLRAAVPDPPGSRPPGSTLGRVKVLLWIVSFGWWGGLAYLLPWLPTPWLMLVLTGVLFAMDQTGFKLSAPTWFIAPGVVIRRRAFRRGLVTYRASEHRLVVIEEGSTRLVFLLTPTRATRVMLRPTETEALLAAWLSPLPPPTDEQLAELGT